MQIAFNSNDTMLEIANSQKLAVLFYNSIQHINKQKREVPIWME